MRNILILLLLSIGVTASYAQTNPATPQAEQYKSELRERIQLDYSMPDFSTSKLDPKIIGDRFSKMLHKLQDKYHDPVLIANYPISFVSRIRI